MTWGEVPDYVGDRDEAERLAQIIRSRYASSSRGVKVWIEPLRLDKQVLWQIRSNIEFKLPVHD